MIIYSTITFMAPRYGYHDGTTFVVYEPVGAALGQFCSWEHYCNQYQSPQMQWSAPYLDKSKWQRYHCHQNKTELERQSYDH